MQKDSPVTPGTIRLVVGLGNPGAKYYHHRHSIGFRVLDELARAYGAEWRTKGEMEITEVSLGDRNIMLVKPMTYMNNSGTVMPALLKGGIKPSAMLVVHDEIEKPFGTVQTRLGGSHRGHNGLRSIIAACGPDFGRLRMGVGRPDDKDEVPDYVLSNFREAPHKVDQLIDDAVRVVEQLVTPPAEDHA